ncbi:hypothetical protein WJX79_009436 [Trebouxia sp. C0005]
MAQSKACSCSHLVTLFQGAKGNRTEDIETPADAEDREKGDVDKDRLARIVKLKACEVGGQDESGVAVADSLLLGRDHSPEHHTKVRSTRLCLPCTVPACQDPKTMSRRLWSLSGHCAVRVQAQQFT